MTLFTFGHGTATQEAIVAILRPACIGLVIDVRIAPGSRRHPHIGPTRRGLERWLPEAGIDYRWEGRLGGFRRPAPDSPDTAWRNDSFHGYAGWTRSDDFAHAMDEVLADAEWTHTDRDVQRVAVVAVSPSPDRRCSGACGAPRPSCT